MLYTELFSTAYCSLPLAEILAQERAFQTGYT